jgi:uncharacterized damage-inducible protein DinB
MGSPIALARLLLDHSQRVLVDNLADLTLEEALFTPMGGYRSVLGTLKHVAGWSHVYRSFAFDEQPTNWYEVDWPWGLRDCIDLSHAYLADVIAWLGQSHQQWQDSLSAVGEEQVDLPRWLHWGQTAPLSEIVVMAASHDVYHAGEINQLLSIYRSEAWEVGEEVEENHISTVGHRVKPAWQR